MTTAKEKNERENTTKIDKHKNKQKKAKNKEQQYLDIIQWNANGFCNGLDKNGPELLKKLETDKITPDIICIQETFLKEPKDWNIENYIAIRKDRKDKPKGGLITFIKYGIIHQEIEAPEEIEGQIIENKTKQRKLHIANIYNPPNNRIDSEA